MEIVGELVDDKLTINEIPQKVILETDSIMRFEKVSFRYPGEGESRTIAGARTEAREGKEVLHDVSFNLDKGKTYALVGPTGGGKTTTASLVARLFDPSSGVIYLD